MIFYFFFKSQKIQLKVSMIKISINGSVNKNLTKILAKMCAQVKKKNNENKQEPQKLPYLKSLKPT